MKYKIVWSETAAMDLITIGKYISIDNPKAARKFVAKLVNRTKPIASHPFTGRIVPEIGRKDIRELIEGNYRIVYQVGEKYIYLLTIFEGHRLFPDLK